ncbi:MAG: hypothetical protein Q8937_17660 [Bacteroidota bacterium]|nr:hypothetical protein [Bacteroidota bacterium]
MQHAFMQMGFELKANAQAFERREGSCIQTFHLLIFKKPDGVYVEPWWSIKFGEILDIYHKVSTKEKKYFKDTPVLENSLGRLIEFTDNGIESGGSKSMQYLIENDKDIDILTNVIPARFQEYVLPYFSANNSVEKVDKLLNSNPGQLSVHFWLYPMKAIMGLIAAKLVNNPQYPELAIIYEEKLRNANPVYKTEFERLELLLRE